jgi:carboxypeptidase T
MKYIFSFFLFIGSLNAFTQDTYARIAIDLSKTSISELQQWQVGLDHFHIEKNQLICELSTFDLSILNQHQASYQVLIPNVQTYYVEQNSTSYDSFEKTTTVGCDDNAVDVLDKYETPSQFSLGSMAGYFTYAEFLAHLDNMSTLYPNLITVKAPIDTFLTHESRPLYWLKISDNPTIDEAEPEVLFTALHHAREPASLSQLIFFMYYILENYTTDANIRALVDSTEIFFVPMINPDGYVYNETTAPNGGGMWRKNRRNNGLGSYGVDLNRNYAYGWGGLGASSNTTSDIYYGPSAFSEPETKAIKYLIESHQFLFTLNYHTFSDLLLYPFGYDLNQPTVDDAYFKAFTPIMVSENGYANIISSELYPASGDSDDWMYGDPGHAKNFAMTPEVGSDDDGFWPAQNKILGLCKENVLSNMTLLELVHDFAQIKEKGNPLINTTSFYTPFDITCLGLDTPSNFTLTITPISSNITSGVSTKTYSSMNLMETRADSVLLNLTSNISNGDQVLFTLALNNGLTIKIDTIVKTYINLTTASLDSCNNLAQWISNGGWATTNTTYYSPSSSITDSPLGNYIASNLSSITLANAIDLSNASYAYAQFYAKWDIENNYDFVQFQASVDGGFNWEPLCGLYTNAGSLDQDFEQPLYDGTSDWVHELVNLHDYIGQSVLLRFMLQSDPFLEQDGYYFDDFQINVLNTAISVSESQTVKPRFFPNPAQSYFSVRGLPKANYSLAIRDVLGKQVFIDTHLSSLEQISTKGLAKGMYIVELKDINTDHIYKERLVLE